MMLRHSGAERSEKPGIHRHETSDDEDFESGDEVEDEFDEEEEVDAEADDTDDDEDEVSDSDEAPEEPVVIRQRYARR